MGKWIVFALSLVATDVAMADCLGPFGYIPEGGSILMYRERNPPKGRRCEWEYRICRNDMLSGSYTETMCTETFDLPENRLVRYDPRRTGGSSHLEND